MDSLIGRVARRVAPFLLGLAPLSLAGCNLDPTDPDNVAPITLVNNTSAAVHVFWCGGDGSNECAEQYKLVVIRAAATRNVHISGSEVLLHIKTASGSEGYVCEDDAPGSRMVLSPSYPSVKSAYRHCSDAASPSSAR